MTSYDYVLSITDGTSGTITLTSSPYAIRSWDVKTAPRETLTLTETIEVRLSGTTTAAHLSTLSTLNRMLDQAEQANTLGVLPKVYLHWKQSASGETWRSPITAARAEWLPTVTTIPYWSGDVQFGRIYIERKNYWEGPEGTALLTNPNGTALASGTVYNANDAGGTPARYNYLDIDGTSITGDLPAATRVHVYNNTAGTGLSYLWIGNNWTNPAGAVQVYEAESAVGSAGTADASCSNGSCVPFSLVSSSGGETTLLTWALTSAAMTAAAGQFVHPVMRFNSAASVTSMRFRLAVFNGVQPLWYSPQIQPLSGYALAMRDMDTFRLPPALSGQSDLSALSLRLTGEQSSGTTLSASLDFIALVPADSFRYLEVAGSVGQNARIVDDGVNGYLYSDDGTANRIGNVKGYGEPITLYPGRDQRIYIWQHSTTANTAPVDESAVVQVYYRPRRLTL